MVKDEKVGDDAASENISNVGDNRRDNSNLLYTVIAVAVGIVAISVVFVSI